MLSLSQSPTVYIFKFKISILGFRYSHLELPHKIQHTEVIDKQQAYVH